MKTALTSMDMVAAAVEELDGNCSLRTDLKEALGYGSQRKQCDAVIRGAMYDIAVKRNEDGTLSLTTDWYRYKSGGPDVGREAKPVSDVFGNEFSKLKAYYSAHKTYAEAKRRGLRSNMHRINNGVHEVRKGTKWVPASKGMWQRIKNMMPLKKKQENASRLWVQCDV
jgi:hypothetical protein